MRNFLKESEHLVRMALTLAAFVLIFLAIRHAVVPRTFGDLGHYRAAALDDIRARPVSFAGKAVCETCHDDVMKTKSEGKHAGVACEACHGPTSAHTEDPMTNHAVKPNPATLCVRCHEADPAKPKTFPQVISKEHAGELSCAECHQPHSPKP
jgi:cytochrome c553